MFKFTFKNLTLEYQLAIDAGYEIITCEEFSRKKKKDKKNTLSKQKIVVNRIDIDLSVKKAKVLLSIFNNLNIKGTFFIRLHASEYNPFSFENYKIIREIVDSGHEIGYHSEVIDQAFIWKEDAAKCLLRDIRVIEEIFSTKVKGVASHGGMTGLNNLDFWTYKKASDFGLLYEAYDEQPNFNLFNTSLYLSDSNWTYWKAYKNGSLLLNDNRSLSGHINESNLIYLLIHPETYYYEHFYE